MEGRAAGETEEAPLIIIMNNLRASLLKTEEEEDHTESPVRDGESAPNQDTSQLFSLKELNSGLKEETPVPDHTEESAHNWSGESVKFSMSDAIKRSDDFWLDEGMRRRRVLLELTTSYLSVRELQPQGKKEKRNLLKLDLFMEDIIGASVELPPQLVVSTYSLVAPGGCKCKKVATSRILKVRETQLRDTGSIPRTPRELCSGLR